MTEPLTDASREFLDRWFPKPWPREQGISAAEKLSTREAVRADLLAIEAPFRKYISALTGKDGPAPTLESVLAGIEALMEGDTPAFVRGYNRGFDEGYGYAVALLIVGARMARAGQAVLDWYRKELWAGPHDWLKEALAEWRRVSAMTASSGSDSTSDSAAVSGLSSVEYESMEAMADALYDEQKD